jgi:hypothetical protein
MATSSSANGTGKQMPRHPVHSNYCVKSTSLPGFWMQTARIRLICPWIISEFLPSGSRGSRA